MAVWRGRLAEEFGVWSNGFCNGLAHCVSNYGSDKLTFGTGTRLTITPSKYFIPGQKISLCLILGVTLDHTDLENFHLSFFITGRDRRQSNI